MHLSITMKKTAGSLNQPASANRDQGITANNDFHSGDFQTKALRFSFGNECKQS